MREAPGGAACGSILIPLWKVSARPSVTWGRLLRLPWLAACAAFSLSGHLSAAEAPGGLVYLAHFDEHAGANWAVGRRAPALPTWRPRFEDGRFGKALSLGGNAWLAITANDGNFGRQQGTVEFWLRPNWDGNDGKAHQLFGARVEKGNYLNVNKLDTNTLGAATGAGGVGRYVRVETDVSHWQAGEWHHVAATWGDGRLAFFLDGEKVGEESGSVPLKRDVAQVRLGPGVDAAIDELAIWSVRKETFAMDAPVAAPDMGPVEMLEVGVPRVTELDRYHFELPVSPRWCTVVPKHFVDEVDPETRPDDTPAEAKLSTFAARGEWQNVGLVVYATSDLPGLAVVTTALRGGDGAIPTESMQVFLNRRVMQRRAPRVPDDDRVPVAALLDPARPFDLPAGHFKEVTVTVRVPTDAAPGDYRGAVKLSSEGRSLNVPLELRVFPFRLTPSPRKEFGVYYLMDMAPQARDGLIADLKDIRDHHCTHLFCWVGMEHRKEGDGVATSYAKLDEAAGLMRELGFRGTQIVQTGFQQMARLLGHEDVSEGQHGESLGEEYARNVERAVRGLDRLKAKVPEIELITTHMDEVMGRKRLQLYLNLTAPIRRVPEQRVYITLHTLPYDYVPVATAKLDPQMDIRGYNGHALDCWIQAGHTWGELEDALEESGDEGWMYYNPHRPFYTAKWSRIINGLYMWWSAVRVHCPYRYRTMRTYPLSFSHNMAYSVRPMEDLVTPLATRQWEGFRLGAQETWYFCMLEDLVAEAEERGIEEAKPAREWLDRLRSTMPTAGEIQDMPDDERKNYPVVLTMASRLDGGAMEGIRRKTAGHIVELGAALREDR